ncbi:hypothetical protein [Lysobacter capsici]|uniref:hypothetical protein n=1 Tax=Lysobacter capsici TaxID=435897 RepID=UPI001BFFDDDA|nr:hypothetical protein [Lysobacter capsici]QWF19118.1 hypothetical protein KME82_10455 [Lysobacter capsici]
MKTTRHVLFALAMLAALSLTACTLPTDPTFANRAPDTHTAPATATVAAEQAES